MPALAIALPITSAAAAATTSAPLVTARLFATFMRFGCKAAGRSGRGFILRRVVSLRGLIMVRLGDRDLLDMRLGLVMNMFAAAASAAPPPAAARPGFAGSGNWWQGNLGFDLELGWFRLACLAANLFEVVLFFQRRDRGLGPLGNRFCRLRRMHLLATIDDKGLRRRTVSSAMTVIVMANRSSSPRKCARF